MPELRLDPLPPPALRQVPPPDGGPVLWTLKATYPAPHGMVYLRAARVGRGSEAALDVLTPDGKLLQRAHVENFDTPPTEMRAKYLPLVLEGNRGPLLRCVLGKTQQFWAFPDGWGGVFSRAELSGKDARRAVWSGLTCADPQETKKAKGADVIECSPPRLPPSLAGRLTRFASVWFGQRFLMRWLKGDGKVFLEVLSPQGQIIERHRLPDDFGASRREGTLSALWLDERQRRGPTLVVRTSDQVRLMVFPRGVASPLVSADFSDASSSISATSVSIGRDLRGRLTVTESYSERGDEQGNPGPSHETTYVWNGKGFHTGKP